jgi:hypothetical protein
MTAVATLDIADLTGAEYQKIKDELGVEKRPEGAIYLPPDHAHGGRLPRS